MAGQRRLDVARSAAREHEPPPGSTREAGRDGDRRIRGRRRAAAGAGARVQSGGAASTRCSSRRCGCRRRRSAGSPCRASAIRTCERRWRHALLDATAQQATLALYYSRLVDQSLLEARRQAVLEERNRIARDIHDTLAQGFGAILMQLQAAQRGGVEPAAGGGAQPRDRRRSRAHASRRSAPLGRARFARSRPSAKTSPRRSGAWSISRSAPATCRSSS